MPNGRVTSPKKMKPVERAISEAGSWTASADSIVDAMLNGSAEDQRYALGLIRALCEMVDCFQLGEARQFDSKTNH